MTRGSTLRSLWPATLPESFARQLNRDADAIAVDAADGSVSYRELDELSDHLAGQLAASGVGPDVLVGICADRGIQLVTGLLAIMKAGGAYVPLDPAYPADRLAFMLADANPRVVLTQGALRERLPIGDETRVIEFGSDGEVAPPRGPDSANNLAYVMYTSGTTGRPKGVAVTHRGVLRLVDEPDYVELNPGETVLQYAPISFDASTFEIWGALVNGARLVVAPPNVQSSDELGDLIRAQGVTTLWLTAPLFHLMVEQRLDSLRGVRQLLAGGDVVSPTHVATALAACDGLTVVNGYGPTETTTFACCHPMSGEIDASLPLPIGKPISQTTVYVLDADLTRAATGAAGELFIAGAGLARGYHNQPGMTAERFLPDPFSRRAGARMYRTGDLARVRADGTVEFLGRADRQVKVRGFRVEPAEVEAVLGTHVAVGQCVVTTWDRGGGERVLVAHVVPRERVSDHELREFLGAKVPDHLVPARFVLAASLPLDANGKVDRAALPPPTWDSGDGFVEPATALERLVADTWCEVLRLERVGTEDRFLELGGDSLAGAKIVARLRQALGLGLSVDAVFEAASVRRLAAAIEQRMLLALGEQGQEGRQ